MLYITLWKEDDIMAEELPSYKTELIPIENLEKDYYEIKIKKPNDMNWVAGSFSGNHEKTRSPRTRTGQDAPAV